MRSSWGCVKQCHLLHSIADTTLQGLAWGCAGSICTNSAQSASNLIYQAAVVQ